MMNLLFRHKDLVKFLAGPDPRDSRADGPGPDQRPGDIDNSGARYGRYVRFARKSGPQSRYDGVHRIIETQQETRHAFVGDRDGSAGPNLFVKEGDHRTPGRKHVAVTNTDKSRAGAQYVCGGDDPLLERFRHSHYIDGLAGLVGADGNDSPNTVALLPDCAHDV